VPRTPNHPFLDAGQHLLNGVFPGLGNAARGVTRFLGLGAYKGASGTLLDASPVPTVNSVADKGVRIVHKEFLSTLQSSVEFTNHRYSINPGLISTFPWLSSIAMGFQKWKINGLIFYFKSTAANMVASTDNSLGAVMGVTQYNAYDPAPIEMSGFLNTAGAMEDKPSRDCVFPVECDRFHSLYPTYFVRSEYVADDIAKYDPGVFNLATIGAQAASTVGQLWVAYDVTLLQPIPVAVGSSAYPFGSVSWLSTDYDNTHQLGNTITRYVDSMYYPTDSEPPSIDLNPAAINIPALGVTDARIFINFDWVGGSAASISMGTFTKTNLTVVSEMDLSGISSAIASVCRIYKQTDPTLPSKLQFGSSTLPASPTTLYACVSVQPAPSSGLRVNRLSNFVDQDDEKELVDVKIVSTCKNSKCSSRPNTSYVRQ
jgi:hypothetical protein